MVIILRNHFYTIVYSQCWLILLFYRVIFRCNANSLLVISTFFLFIKNLLWFLMVPINSPFNPLFRSLLFIYIFLHCFIFIHNRHISLSLLLFKPPCRIINSVLSLMLQFYTPLYVCFVRFINNNNSFSYIYN